MRALLVSVDGLRTAVLERCVGPDDVEADDEDDEDEDVATAEAAFLAAIAVGERRPMPEEKYIFEMGRA